MNKSHQPSQPLRGDRELITGPQTKLKSEMLFTPAAAASPFRSLLTKPGPAHQMLGAKLDDYKAGLLAELNSESKSFHNLVRSALARLQTQSRFTRRELESDYLPANTNFREAGAQVSAPPLEASPKTSSAAVLSGDRRY